MVWAALTTAEGLGTWFGNATTIDLRSGGTAQMTWTRGEKASLRVERVEEPTVFGFTWGINGLPDDDLRRTYVEFSLTPAGAISMAIFVTRAARRRPEPGLPGTSVLCRRSSIAMPARAAPASGTDVVGYLTESAGFSAFAANAALMTRRHRLRLREVSVAPIQSGDMRTSPNRRRSFALGRHSTTTSSTTTRSGAASTAWVPRTG
jgi:uncharacterized protein YndB with AHSA1/START domain